MKTATISIIVLFICFLLYNFTIPDSQIHAQTSSPQPTVTVTETITPTATPFPEEKVYTAKDFVDKAIIGENKSFAIIPLDLNSNLVDSGTDGNRQFITQILNEFCKRHQVRLASWSIIPCCNTQYTYANALAVTFYPVKKGGKVK